MSSDALYKEALLEHFKHPRSHRKEPFEPGYLTARGRNPRCGDDVEVGLMVQDGRVAVSGFRGRGCSICMASTSMLVEAVEGADIGELRTLYKQVINWGDDASALPAALEALDAVRSSPSRKKCALLGWNALGEILEQSQN